MLNTRSPAKAGHYILLKIEPEAVRRNMSWVDKNHRDWPDSGGSVVFKLQQ
jgi:hypothetical protein